MFIILCIYRDGKEEVRHRIDLNKVYKNFSPYAISLMIRGLFSKATDLKD